MKKRLFQVTCLVVLIATIIALSACGGDKIDYKVANAMNDNGEYVPYYVYNSGFFSDFAIKIDTLDKFAEFCDEKIIEYGNGETLSNNLSDDFDGKLKSYDKDFFKDKALVVVCRYKTSMQTLYFGSLAIKDDVLNVELKKPKDDDVVVGAAVLASLVFLIEIDKPLVENVNQIVVLEI